MAYKHKQVSDINTHQPQFFHHHTLQLFCEELTKQVRGVKTTPRDDKSQWVYVDGEMMARGWVGYGDYQSSRYGDPKLVVSARGVSNGKYGDYSDQYYMKMSVNMKVALKAAKTWLTKYTTREIDTVFRPTVRDQVTLKQSNLRDRVSKLTGVLGVARYGREQDRILTELRRLSDSGHNFADPVFGVEVRELFSTQKSLDSLGDHTPMDFIHIYPTPWETRADILHIYDAQRYPRNAQGEMKTWVADELPESAMGKVAVMQMCEDGQYVEDVGYRVNEHTFYVHSEGSDTWK